MVISIDGKPSRDLTIKTLSANIGNVSNKRIAVCLDCGHTWEPRNSTTAKPSLCSKCKSRNCTWNDELHQTTAVLSPVALMATVDGKPVTVETIPKPTENKEKEQISASAIASEVISQIKKETEESTSIEDEDETKPDDKLVKAVASEVFNMIQESEAKDSKKVTAVKNDMRVNPKDESDSKAVCEALRQIYGDDVQVIDNPIKKLAEEDSETPMFAVWKNEDGSISQGVIINPETFAEAEKLLKEKEAAERLNITDIHLDRMNEGELLDIEEVLDDADYEDDSDEIEACEGIEEEEEAKPKQNKGVPAIAVVIIGGIGLMALLPIILDSVKNRKKAEDEKNKREKSIIAPLMPNYRGNPFITGKLNGF